MAAVELAARAAPAVPAVRASVELVELVERSSVALADMAANDPWSRLVRGDLRHSASQPGGSSSPEARRRSTLSSCAALAVPSFVVAPGETYVAET